SQVAGQYDQADQRERHTYEEAPAPAEPGRIDDHAADQRAADRSDGHRGAEVAVVAAAITRRDDGADDRLRERHQPAHTDALQTTGGEQLGYVLRDSGQHRANNEDDDR